MYLSLNKFFIGACLGFVSLTASAQQMAFNDAYLLNPAILDPSYAGQLDHQYHIGIEEKWLGVEGAPRTAFAAADFVWKNIGFQVGYAMDEAGPVSRTAPQITIAPTVKLDENQNLHFGLTSRLDNWVVDYTKPRIFSPGDPVFSSIVNTGIRPNIGMGMTYTYGSKFYAGLSVLDLVGNGWTQQNQLKSTSHLFMGYNHSIDDKNTLKVSGVLNRTAGTPVDANLHFIWANDPLGSAGIIYSPKDAVGFMVSTPYDGMFRLFYSYTYPLNDLGVVSNQSHLIGISISPKLAPCNLQGPRYF